MVPREVSSAAETEYEAVVTTNDGKLAMHRKMSTALQEMLAFLAVGVLTYPPWKAATSS